MQVCMCVCVLPCNYTYCQSRIEAKNAGVRVCMCVLPCNYTYCQSIIAGNEAKNAHVCVRACVRVCMWVCVCHTAIRTAS
jgi:hypothetical protein